MVYRVRTALGREIVATAEHPLLTMQGWRALVSLRAATVLLQPVRSPRWGVGAGLVTS